MISARPLFIHGFVHSEILLPLFCIEQEKQRIRCGFLMFAVRWIILLKRKTAIHIQRESHVTLSSAASVLHTLTYINTISRASSSTPIIPPVTGQDPELVSATTTDPLKYLPKIRLNLTLPFPSWYFKRTFFTKILYEYISPILFTPLRAGRAQSV